jgi:hypothetical protein
MATFLALDVQGYRFVCNGLLADGQERSDSCGICDIAHAARWQNPNIAVVIDNEPLPKGISQSEWQDVVKTSLGAWEDVSGSSVRFIKKDGNNPREFGANESLHEVFWITDVEEWRRLVGSGEFGTLGATLPRYSCGGQEGAKRTIMDADLVLNGMSHINWQVDCKDDDCISIQTTLVHELGHFFGLDHPCLMCSTSIMSARAGFDLLFPVFDDMEGARALYPDNSKGAFGFSCRTDQDCGTGMNCIVDSDNRYCSSSCNTDADCEMGAICQTNNEKLMCTFIDSAHAGGADLGEACSRVPCREPFICAGASEDKFFCFMPCENDQACDADKRCHKIDDKVSLCVRVKALGETCDHKELCADDAYCVFDNDSFGFCRASCRSDSAGKSCASGLTCKTFTGGEKVCVPEKDDLDLGDGSSSGFGESGAEIDGREGLAPKASAPSCATTANSAFLSIYCLLALSILIFLRKSLGKRSARLA